MAAGAVLSVGLAVKIGFDVLGVDPSTYGLSIRDGAIIIALAVFSIGLRSSARFWDQSLSKGFSGTSKS